MPFDAAAETPVEEQRAQALARIQTGLVAGDAPRALALLRASRYSFLLPPPRGLPWEGPCPPPLTFALYLQGGVARRRCVWGP